jgi:beta-glucosidase
MSGDLTLDEAIDLLSGADLSHTRGVAGVPMLTMSDGPSGLAMNLPDWSGKVPATCFPAAGTLAATWDADLLRRVGSAIAAEARRAGADMLLAPSVNIRRSPLGGRGFEYYSEDPVLSGVLGAAFVDGVQAAGVAACVKHYAVNSQETDRMRVSAELSEAALREIYLSAFEHIVKTSAPAAVMASYNRVNGTYVTQHRELLTTILRDEWGFDGAVISDWGAVDDPVAAVLAGLDLEMPGPALGSRERLRAAANSDDDVRAAIHVGARRMARLAETWTGREPVAVDLAVHHELAVEASTAAITLLTNDGTLPLVEHVRSIAVVGELASSPQIQGGGSAGVQAERTDSFLAALAAGTPAHVHHYPGYDLRGAPGDGLAQAAVEGAIAADVVIVVVGPGEGADTEGRDRDGIDLPAAQVALVERLVATGTPTVVVLNNGGVVATSPWSEGVGALVSWGLPGDGGGQALADVLLGAADPSGRLVESIPVSLADTPTFGSFPTPTRALHAEGVLVGYRWYDVGNRAVAFPFGHGLSYTSFELSELEIPAPRVGDVPLRFRVTNTGRRDGVMVWQCYVGPRDVPRGRPVRQLATFGRLRLAAGQSAVVEATVPLRAFQAWDESRATWVDPGGEFTVSIGSSSRDLLLDGPVDRDRVLPALALDARSTLREWLTHPVLGLGLLAAAAEADASGATTRFLTDPTIALMIGDLPIGRLFGDPSQAVSEELLAAAARR